MTIDDRRHRDIERTRRETLRVQMRHVRSNHERRSWQSARSMIERVCFPALPLARVGSTCVHCTSVHRMCGCSCDILSKTRRCDWCAGHDNEGRVRHRSITTSSNESGQIRGSNKRMHWSDKRLSNLHKAAARSTLETFSFNLTKALDLAPRSRAVCSSVQLVLVHGLNEWLLASAFFKTHKNKRAVRFKFGD